MGFSQRAGGMLAPHRHGKTLVALLWLKSLLEAGQVKKALILEPTRLLVNQASRIPRQKRAGLWQSKKYVN